MQGTGCVERDLEDMERWQADRGQELSARGDQEEIGGFGVRCREEQ